MRSARRSERELYPDGQCQTGPRSSSGSDEASGSPGIAEDRRGAGEVAPRHATCAAGVTMEMAKLWPCAVCRAQGLEAPSCRKGDPKPRTAGRCRPWPVRNRAAQQEARDAPSASTSTPSASSTAAAPPQRQALDAPRSTSPRCHKGWGPLLWDVDVHVHETVMEGKVRRSRGRGNVCVGPALAHQCQPAPPHREPRPRPVLWEKQKKIL